jgi:ATP-binding cassette, subfamily G (WHITE), member 1
MFDKLVMLTDGQTIYRGQVKTLVPFLAGMGLECPSYHNPVGKMLPKTLGP